MNLKKFLEETTQNFESTPNMTNGQHINKILKVEFKDTQYRNAKGGIQQVAVVTTDNGVFHTTAKAIVDTLHSYFVDKKIAEPMENIDVKEERSKDGRMYLTLDGA